MLNDLLFFLGWLAVVFLIAVASTWVLFLLIDLIKELMNDYSRFV